MTQQALYCGMELLSLNINFIKKGVVYMAENTKTPIRGKDKILYFRLLKDAAENKAARLALQVEHEWSYERDNEVVQTKDGGIVQEGALEVSLELTAISTKDKLNTMLRQAVTDGLKLEVWEVDISDNRGENKRGALYAQGNLNEWSVPANVEELEEITTSMSIDGQPLEGEVDLSTEDLELIKAVYEFRDLQAVGA